MPPVSLDRLNHRSISGVHEAGSADANAEDGAVRRGDHLVHQLHGEPECVVTVRVLGRDLDTVNVLAAEADGGSGKDSIPQIDPNEEPAAIGNLEQDRGLAPGGGTAPDITREAGCEQPSDDVRNRGPREAGQSRDFRATDGTLVVDGREDELLVVLARFVQRSLDRSLHPDASSYFVQGIDKATLEIGIAS